MRLSVVRRLEFAAVGRGGRACVVWWYASSAT